MLKKNFYKLNGKVFMLLLMKKRVHKTIIQYNLGFIKKKLFKEKC